MKCFLYCLLSVVLVLLPAAALHAQSSEPDILYIKDGSTVKGTIIELLRDRTVTIRTADSSIYIYPMADVKKFSMHSLPIAKFNDESEEMHADQLPHSGDERNRMLILYCGISIPYGAFRDAKAAVGGTALTGFAVGADADVPVGGKSSMMVSLDYAINGMEVEAAPAGAGITAEASSWTSLWTLVGVKVSGSASRTTELFGFAQGGFLYGSTPEITVRTGSAAYTEQITYSSTSAYAVGYGFGIGAQSNRFSLCIRYLGANPKYELHTPYTDIWNKPYAAQSTACLLITAGAAF